MASWLGSRSAAPAVVALACAGHAGLSPNASTNPPSVATSAASSIPEFSPLHCDLGSFIGFSGLAMDGDGRLWAVPEEQRYFVRVLQIEDTLQLSGQIIPIVNVPDNVDLESVAWIGGDQFLLGTEGQEDRTYDDLLFAKLTAEHVEVSGAIRLDYSGWGIRAPDNWGVEGLCAANGQVLVGSEVVGEMGGRFSVLARYDLERQRWFPMRLRLTSDTGRISAVACKTSPEVGGLVAYAIERHFGVMRLLRFAVAISESDAMVDIEPEIAVDLAREMDEPPNFEGIEFVDGALVLLSDNYYKRQTTTTHGLLLRL